ncbi:MAG: PSP1 domain-containing protein [Bacteroidales bacterium]
MNKITNINNTLFSRGCCCAPNPENPADSPYKNSCAKFAAHDYLSGIAPASVGGLPNVAEIRFKNNHKEFMQVPPELRLKQGEIVAVEGNPGHDIGIVSLTGYTAFLQMKAKGIDLSKTELRKVFRHARPADIEKWIAVSKREEETLLKTRKIAEDLGLQMKLNDVEYQGDGGKAIFYYTADDRVDFRELIKVLAERFRIKVEMRQIGLRQEASKVGGIGSCGRELCCSTFINKFRSVSTQAAKVQQLSPNPQKLAGQCGKLKCCLNYEFETYIDALQNFPSQEIVLETTKGKASCLKIDVFKRLMWYVYEHEPNNIMAIPADKVVEIHQMNLQGSKPENLEEFAQIEEPKAFLDVPATDFDAFKDLADE